MIHDFAASVPDDQIYAEIARIQAEAKVEALKLAQSEEWDYMAAAILKTLLRQEADLKARIHP